MGRTPFGSSMDTEVFELLEKLTEELGPPKNRILEASIEVFAALPLQWQYVLKSNNRKDRALCLDLIRAIGSPEKQGKLAPASKSSKSG